MEELASEVSPLSVGDASFVLVRAGRRLIVADAACPHRGAHLGYGATLGGEGDDLCLVCPFHGRRIALGGPRRSPWRVETHRTIIAGPCVFTRFGTGPDHAFAETVERLLETHLLVPGFRLHAPVAPELVIENAFDGDHFVAVHGIESSPALRLIPSRHGELAVSGTFVTRRPNPWQGEPSDEAAAVETTFEARAYSPGIVVSRLRHQGGDDVVITAATPDGAGGSVIRVSVAVEPPARGGLPPAERVHSLVQDSRTAFEQDLEVWTNLVVGASPSFVEGDEAVEAFAAFCAVFRDRPEGATQIRTSPSDSTGKR